MTIGLKFHDSVGTQEGDSVTVNARGTVAIADIVRTRFARESATGAIEITVPDALANKVAITSRTFNRSSAGEFGQDIPAVNANDAASAGDVVVLQGPSSVIDDRFNFGLYALTDAAVRWELVRADGSLATPLAEQSYRGGTQIQFNQGIERFLTSTPQNNDAVHAVVTKGRVIAYGSAVNNRSGDPSFVPGIRVRVDIRLNFVGVDLNQDGIVDVFDADHDGVLDQPLDIFTSMFPNDFRVIVTGPNGEPATLELIDAPEALLIDFRTVSWAPGGDEKGKSGVLKIRATAGGISEILTIPANFR
jgi:hypothetical protein